RPASDAQLDLARATGWHVEMIPKIRAAEPGGNLTTRQLGWLRTMIEVPEQRFAANGGDSYYYAVALYVTGGEPKKITTIGMLEISKPNDVLTSGDLGRALALVVLIVTVTTMMVGLLASRLVSRPITKLLRGIDDVAKGDLSHVI